LQNYNIKEKQLREGWKKCIENIEGLLCDAKLLSNDKTYNRKKGQAVPIKWYVQITLTLISFPSEE